MYKYFAKYGMEKCERVGGGRMARMGVLLYVLSLGLRLPLSVAMPPQHRGWLRLWEEGEDCGECQRHRCPPAPPNCPAGWVRDRCGCCEQCGNAEGQLCDLDGAQNFYGRCGEGLRCLTKEQRDREDYHGDDPEPTCVCLTLGTMCGSDGQTYHNLCQLREAANRERATLRLAGQGPCYSAPRVTRFPRDLENHTGNDIIFSCEVSAYPLPLLSWKKEGDDNLLPGDDPHVSVQSRGGPERYTMSTWLQIEGLRLSDSGVYVCVSHNALGHVSSTARLTVLQQDMRASDSDSHGADRHHTTDPADSGEDDDSEDAEWED